jgi:hypothetical protein
LNQDDIPHNENEEDARNTEHEGEDEENAEEALVGAFDSITSEAWSWSKQIA